jgi:hypothetical protein
LEIVSVEGVDVRRFLDCQRENAEPEDLALIA